MLPTSQTNVPFPLITVEIWVTGSPSLQGTLATQAFAPSVTVSGPVNASQVPGPAQSLCFCPCPLSLHTICPFLFLSHLLKLGSLIPSFPALNMEATVIFFSFCLLKCSCYAILYRLQVYNMVIHTFWMMYSIYSYKMLDMFPVAVQPLLVDYFIPSSLSLLTPYPYIAPPPPSPHW